MLGEFHRSMGLELSGSKNDRSAFAILDFYKSTERLVLVDIESKITGFGETNSDEALAQALHRSCSEAKNFTGLGIHGPLSLPPYFQTDAKIEALPFPHASRNPEVKWMNLVWKKIRPKPRPFAPYLQRPAEIWLRHLTPERFQISDALGSNAAPLAARLRFLAPHFPQPLFEVFPRATLLRIVSSLGLPKTLARDYSDMERGLSTREHFFNYLAKKVPQIFIYEKDLESMILNLSCFNAFLAALTQHLIFAKQVESPPKGFPRPSTWIFIPKAHLNWDDVFK